MSRHFWRVPELRVLRQHFPAGGVAACEPLLPGRSAAAIYAQAHRLGLATPRAARNVNSNAGRSLMTSAQRAQLARVIARPVSWGAVKKLAAAWGVAPATARARVLWAGGRLLRTRPRWTRAQDRLLREHCDLPPQRLALLLRPLGTKRSPMAVYVRLQRLGLLGRGDPDGYSALELSRLLGVGRTWAWRHVAAGRLEATRRDGLIPRQTQRPGPWFVSRQAVRRFLVQHPDVLARVRRTANRTWLADLLGELPRHTDPAHRGDGAADHHREAA